MGLGEVRKDLAAGAFSSLARELTSLRLLSRRLFSVRLF